MDSIDSILDFARLLTEFMLLECKSKCFKAGKVRIGNFLSVKVEHLIILNVSKAGN